MTKSNLITNTGHRFVSKGKTAFKIHVHTPDDTVIHRSVGFLRLGEDKALKKAIEKRDELGKELWGNKLWLKILSDPYLFTRLPHSLEPAYVEKVKSKMGSKMVPYYLAKWSVIDESGKRQYKTKLANIEKLGKLAAYNQAKRALIEAHKDYLDILTHMGRFNVIKFQ